MQSWTNFLGLLLVLVALESTLVDGEPEPMARPTRPKVFTSPEELRRYLDLVRDYYSLNGKARYGKRGDVSLSTDTDHPWDALRTILDVHRQMQRKKFERGRDEKEQFLREFEGPDVNGRSPRNDDRASYVLDIVGKYYDDVQ